MRIPILKVVYLEVSPRAVIKWTAIVVWVFIIALWFYIAIILWPK